ncbi:MAG: hypothetical protein ACT4PE_05260 [Candidatus Eiseniibacteriota bacterium]
MRARKRVDAVQRFFRVLFESGRVQILGLASAGEHIRDGMALARIVWLLASKQLPRIVVEPSRSRALLEENVVFIGATLLFVEPGPSGTPQPAEAQIRILPRSKIGKRLDDLHQRCCYRLVKRGGRIIVNSVTGEVYRPVVNRVDRVVEDYAVIRRTFRNHHGNTITFEGVHRLGTYAAVKFATDPIYLKQVWDAVSELDVFDESVPLEILVKATFHDDGDEGVYAHDDVIVTPMQVVYDRRWIYDLGARDRWRDQGPWDVQLAVEGRGRPQVLRPGTGPRNAASLELEADLSELGQAARERVRRVFAVPDGKARVGVMATEAASVVETLVAEAERFGAGLVDGQEYTRLPERGAESRDVRKKFVVHLALCRMLGIGVPCDAAAIRRCYPELSGKLSDAELEGAFKLQVRGRIERGFGAVFANRGGAGPCAVIELSRRSQIYQLRLEAAALVLRLRL